MSQFTQTLPQRRRLYHDVPSWVSDGACFFITICSNPRGKNQLAVPLRATAIMESVTHYHRSGIWWVHAFLLMPDHVHALICVAPDQELTLTIRSWKGWQTKTQGICWQSGFFDHRLRSDESHEEKAHYIKQNPVRAGLVAKAEEWPFAWDASSLEISGSPGGFALPQTKNSHR